jgi:hypothetical protein
MAWNNKMCKNKWNDLNFDYKKITYYQKGIGHISSLWELNNNEQDKHHLLKKFNWEYYGAIEPFKEKKFECCKTCQGFSS